MLGSSATARTGQDSGTLMSSHLLQTEWVLRGDSENEQGASSHEAAWTFCRGGSRSKAWKWEGKGAICWDWEALGTLESTGRRSRCLGRGGGDKQ